MMNNAPAFLSSRSLKASVVTTIEAKRSAYRPVVSASLPDTVIGNNKGPISIEK